MSDSNSDYLIRLYEAAFHRAPDTDGFNWNLNLLNTGAVSHEGMANAFAFSPEFGIDNHGLPTSDAQFVTDLYQNELHRNPDIDGLAGWLTQLSHGATRGAVMVGIVDSPEAHAIWGS